MAYKYNYIPNTTEPYKPTSNPAYVIRYRDPAHHFKIIQKFGFPPGVKCWCGADLEFAVNEPWTSRDKKRKAWFHEHEECSPKEREQ